MIGNSRENGGRIGTPNFRSRLLYGKPPAPLRPEFAQFPLSKVVHTSTLMLAEDGRAQDDQLMMRHDLRQVICKAGFTPKGSPSSSSTPQIPSSPSRFGSVRQPGLSLTASDVFAGCTLRKITEPESGFRFPFRNLRSRRIHSKSTPLLQSIHALLQTKFMVRIATGHVQTVYCM